MLVTIIISSMIHLNKKQKKKRLRKEVDLCRRFKVRWNWYTQFHRLDSHFNRIFPIFHYLYWEVAEVSYLIVCIFWSFYDCIICCQRQSWKYYENINGEKMKTLPAGYTFSGFVLLYFPPVTSCPLRGLYFQLVKRPYNKLLSI